MRAKLTLFAMSMCVGLAQDTSVARVFKLHHVETEQDLQEFATAIRTVADLPQVSVDTAGKSIALRGTPTQVAIAEYLFTELDRQTMPEFASKVFRVPNNEDDVVRVFILQQTATINNFQEVATTIRTITEIRRVFTYNRPRALTVRGTADQIAAAEFLIRELDQPAGAKRMDSREYQMIDTGKHGETEVRVFYLPYAADVQQLQEVATLVRTIGEIRRVFTYDAPKALILRGTGDQLALADWLVKEMGKPVTAETFASQTYQYPDVGPRGEPAVRVFYVHDAPTPQAVQELATRIRTMAQIRRVFTYNASKAIAVRGTAEQVAAAEQMLKDRQIAAK
jgi:hypothetical protein